jgi:hypothetical protein
VEVLTLLLFIGGIWVFVALAFFAWTQFNANDEHADRLALLPLEDNWRDPEKSIRLADEKKERAVPYDHRHGKR